MIRKIVGLSSISCSVNEHLSESTRAVAVQLLKHDSETEFVYICLRNLTRDI